MSIKRGILSLLAAFGLLVPIASASDNLSYLNTVAENSPIILKHDLTVQRDKFLVNGLENAPDSVQSYYHYSHRSHSSHSSHRSHYSHYSSRY